LHKLDGFLAGETKMTATTTLSDNASWIEQEQDILPIMTAIFVDGLGPVYNRSGDNSQRWLSKASSTTDVSKIFRLHITADQNNVSPAKELKSSATRSDRAIDGICNRTADSTGGHIAVRTLISGISHHFNNLLMGIWGNASLIRMQLSPKDSRYVRVEQMERLIQSGAFLIHMVLGYLGERRTVAKQIRLNQLISEIRSETGVAVGVDDPWNFEARLKWASRVQRPRMIASSTARVLEVLFRGIENHCKAILAQNLNDESILKKLATIDVLVARGLDITCKLRLYGGDYQSRAKNPIKIGLLVNRLLKKVKAGFPNIRLYCRISDRLPLIRADRWQLELALEEIFSNAANVMPDGGTLIITVQTLNQEAPNERCGAQKSGDYLVISIKDSGSGISRYIQPRIFEPFFAEPKRYARKGLGLAVVVGVLKFHDGFVHVQSEEGVGSQFKLCFPLSNTQQSSLNVPSK